MSVFTLMPDLDFVALAREDRQCPEEDLRGHVATPNTTARNQSQPPGRHPQNMLCRSRVKACRRRLIGVPRSP
jgi:hypothetical protein